MNIEVNGTDFPVEICPDVWSEEPGPAVVALDAFADAWHDAERDIFQGIKELDEKRISLNIAANIGKHGYDILSPCVIEYAAYYREEYLAAFPFRHNEEAEWKAFADAMLRAEDARKMCPESLARWDANYDAAWAAHCKAHGHSGGPRAERNLAKHNPDNDADYARRYTGAYNEAYPDCLTRWRRYEAEKKTRKSH